MIHHGTALDGLRRYWVDHEIDLSEPKSRSCDCFHTASLRQTSRGATVSLYRLAQLNIAKMKEPLESPSMADFVANLDRINTLAEQSPGFVWRLKDDSGDATAIRPFGDDVIVNMSLWRDVPSLSNFAFKTAHVEIMRRRREWFERMAEAYAVLWWVPKDHRPSVTEAKERLQYLQKYGATPEAFTFKAVFPAPDSHDTTQLVVSK